MKQLIIILLAISGFRPLTESDNVRVLTVAKESKISILGSSNVNTFSLDIKEYSGCDTLVLVQRNNQQPIIFQKGILRIPVVDFKNGNPVLTKDFRKVVKAKTYPEATMIFRSISVFPCGKKPNVQGEAEVLISLSGYTKITKINVTLCRDGETVILNGTTSLCFSDFRLTPPENVLGFIDVNDDIKVKFSLTLEDITGKVAYRK